MANLSTEFCGITLKNPLIAGSSALTGTLAGVKKLAVAGIAGVVLKSLFEEQLKADVGMGKDEYDHPEIHDFLEGQAMALAPSTYLDLIRKSREETDIAIWASLNCLEGDRWEVYAKEIEKAGASGLELNIAPQTFNKNDAPGWAENQILSVVRKVRAVTKLPLSVKLGNYFSSLTWLVEQLRGKGVQGVVLFNRFYKTDMDVDHLTTKPGPKISVPSDFLDTLRWTAILAPQKLLDIAATQGILSIQEVLKALLAGSQVVQISSLLYSKGLGSVEDLLQDLSSWMDKKEFKNLGAFRGALSRKSDQGASFDRLQYIKALTGME